MGPIWGMGSEFSDNSDKWLSMPTVKPTIHTIMKDYSDKLKAV